MLVYKSPVPQKRIAVRFERIQTCSYPVRKQSIFISFMQHNNRGLHCTLGKTLFPIRDHIINQRLASIKYNFKKIVLNRFLSANRLPVKVEKNLAGIARGAGAYSQPTKNNVSHSLTTVHSIFSQYNHVFQTQA